MHRINHLQPALVQSHDVGIKRGVGLHGSSALRSMTLACLLACSPCVRRNDGLWCADASIDPHSLQPTIELSSECCAAGCVPRPSVGRLACACDRHVCADECEIRSALRFVTAAHAPASLASPQLLQCICASVIRNNIAQRAQAKMESLTD
jgi:hypothetical protein